VTTVEEFGDVANVAEAELILAGGAKICGVEYSIFPITVGTEGAFCAEAIDSVSKSANMSANLKFLTIFPDLIYFSNAV